MRIFVNVLYVAVGAALGGALRYLATVFIQHRTGPGFPVATLVINVSGSLLLGFLVAYFAETTAVRPEIGLLLTSGLCGGYTTFSTFTYETFMLMRDGEYQRAGVYILLSVSVGIAAMIAGFAAARGTVHLQRGGS